MPKQEREALFRSISDSVLSEGAFDFGEGKEEDRKNARSLWLDIREEAEASIDEQLGIAIASGLFKERGGSGADTLEAKVKATSQKKPRTRIQNIFQSLDEVGDEGIRIGHYESAQQMARFTYSFAWMYQCVFIARITKSGMVGVFIR
ncbi:UNVERIFIED_CONTAM: hypothetical protein HDU68_007439 [Siphonaria sp. JEL0065]|nr:hypothetical protein HDU68_007439 [Siphonaria sp. JEL0065]